MRLLITTILATGLWMGLSIDPRGDSSGHWGFLDLQTAIAAKGEGGNSGGGNRGNSAGGKGGKSGKADSESRGKSGERGKRARDDDGRRNLRAELRGLNSLGRNINGLINSSDEKLAGFRALYVNADGSLKDDVELPDDETLALMIGDYLGSEPSEDAVIDTRARLEILAEQQAELRERSERDDDDDDDEDDEDDDDEDDEDDDDSDS